MSNYSCSSTPLIKLVDSGIENLEKLAKHSPSKKNELSMLRNALKTYEKDCKICKKDGDNDRQCLKLALDKLYRSLPFIRNSVYPWQNYDWDYTNFVDNNYSARATGSSNSGSAYIKNLRIFFKLFKAYIRDANPNQYSVAGGIDKNSDYPIYGCLGNNKKYCNVRQLVKNSDRQGKPYNDQFFNRNTNGEYASSYFVRVGSCPRPDITDRDICAKMQYDWTNNIVESTLSNIGGGIPDGSCTQPRYAFINNQPGLEIKTPSIRIGSKETPNIKLGKLKGYIPSVANDFLALTPDKLFSAFTGNSIKGYLDVQKCPKFKKTKKGYVREDFTNKHSQNFLFNKILSATIFLYFIVIFIVLLLYRWYNP